MTVTGFILGASIFEKVGHLAMSILIFLFVMVFMFITGSRTYRRRVSGGGGMGVSGVSGVSTARSPVAAKTLLARAQGGDTTVPPQELGLDTGLEITHLAGCCEYSWRGEEERRGEFFIISYSMYLMVCYVMYVPSMSVVVQEGEEMW